MKKPLRYPLQLRPEMLPTDAFFWFAEAATPRLRPLVSGLFMLDRRPDRSRFRASIEWLVMRIPRLRQSVVEPALPFGLPRWRDDPHFDLNYHLRSVVLPEPANERHLLDFASAVFATPLDHLRPLWESYLIEGLDSGRAAYFLKMHHSVMDGEGAVALFDAMTQPRRNQPVPPPRATHPAAESDKGGADLVELARAGWRSAAAGVDMATGMVGRILREPGQLLDQLTHTAGSVRRIVDELRAPLPADPLSARCTGVGRRLATVAFDLDRLQRLRGALGITLNDLMLTTVAGAVGRYHRYRGIDLLEVPCIVPVSLRQEHERTQLGNRVTAVNVALPVRQPNPLIRLERIRGQTAAVRANRSGAGYGVFIQALPFIPSAVYRAIAGNAKGRVHLICSNVAGPPVHRYLAGAAVEAVYAFAPIMLGIPLSIALLSYGKRYAAGIDADPAAIPDPERIGEFLHTEVAAIERRVLGPITPKPKAASPPVRLVRKGKP